MSLRGMQGAGGLVLCRLASPQPHSPSHGTWKSASANYSPKGHIGYLKSKGYEPKQKTCRPEGPHLSPAPAALLGHVGTLGNTVLST